ncbi:MAG: bifunctional folylpolyglutamate synthase/dihydrofolate synthase [Flavobacteriales bacterium]|nr:bifunctional folylpolyglutamate synthase/dihydrofolate synthase [Flavobacteriales bacterium]
MSKYNKSIAFLYEQLPVFQRVGAKAYKKDLDTTIKLLESLDNPEKYFKSIHVAGTNGKGSVSTMLAEILRKNHYDTGLYTSPHLVDFRERIRVSGKKVRKKFIKEFVQKYKDTWQELSPSFFEITVAMAFEYFSQEEVDIAVVEVGLGGRLDSTNVIDPEVSIITRIGLDHQQFLGNTLEEIASEKAGIVKPNKPVILGPNQDSVIDVVKEVAARKGSDIYLAEHFLSDLPYTIPDYQRENMGIVFKTCEVLKTKGWNINMDKIVNQMIKTITKKIKGRWQILDRSPLTIADAAHNENGVKALTKQLGKIDYRNLHIVYGSVNDKEIDSVLSLMPKLAQYYFCKANIPRGMPAIDLQKKCAKYGMRGSSYISVKDAFEAARSNAESEDLILVTGSIYVLAEAI